VYHQSKLSAVIFIPLINVSLLHDIYTTNSIKSFQDNRPQIDVTSELLCRVGEMKEW